MEKKNNGTLVGILIGIILMLLVFIGLFFTNTISLSSDKETESQQNNMNEIIGNYEFSEYTEPNQNMVYELQISGEYSVILKIDGFQTSKRIKAKIEYVKNRYNISYDENLSEVQENVYKKGDVLFSLYKKNNEIYTCWSKLQPMLGENKKDGVYFKIKANIEKANTQDELGKNDTFSASSESGVVEVIGYAEVKEIVDQLDTGEKYNYVFFHIKETKSEEFKKYLESLQGNSFVRDNTIGLGCVINSKIKYHNHSDEKGAIEYELSDTNSNKILSSTESNPVKLKLERLKLSYGKGAPVCYSHITNIEVVD